MNTDDFSIIKNFGKKYLCFGKQRAPALSHKTFFCNIEV